MSDAGLPPNETTNGSADSSAPSVRLVGQYIKDLSFENPMTQGQSENPPKIEMNIGLQVQPKDQDLFEVELKIRLSATDEAKPLFLVELAYAGLYYLHNIPEEARKPILMIQAPTLLFPFARRIVGDVTRDGGINLPLLDPIDFAMLYQRQEAEAQGQINTPVANA